ncbi:MAG: iron-containing alcohol dehydrogenase [Verrucomicrobia bacterium]|nr:iron-containing alcohol dehydrogenase [Verrucomicrobiota bacterium]
MNPLTSIDLDALPIPIRFGEAALSLLGGIARETGGTRALLITDHGVRAAGHVNHAEACLRDSGLQVSVFDDVHENPTTDDVDACVCAARTCHADILIGLGGGSSMDAAKGCNFLISNGGRIQDYWGVDKATQPMLPFIAVPTTAGTGSECQRFALISDVETHQKMACGDPKAAARCAILDPRLTLTQPPYVTACTGADAIAHAIETSVTRAATKTSLAYSHEAFRLLSTHMATVLKTPDNIRARAAMQLGAALAGTAIEHSMLGAAHAAANSLTAHFNVIHGQAVSITLPHVIRLNARALPVAEAYRVLMAHAGLVAADASAAQAVDALLAFLEKLGATTGLPRALRNFGVSLSDVRMLGAEASQQWTGTFNPCVLTAEDYEQIYRNAF